MTHHSVTTWRAEEFELEVRYGFLATLNAAAGLARDGIKAIFVDALGPAQAAKPAPPDRPSETSDAGTEMSNNHKAQGGVRKEGPEMPVLLKHISIGASFVLLALSWATASIWFPGSVWGKLAALLLAVAAAPPITAIMVLELADLLSGGELRRTGSTTTQRK